MTSTKKELTLLIVLLLVFAVLFGISLINLKRGMPVFGIGMNYKTENYLVAGLSILSTLKIFWAIIKH